MPNEDFRAEQAERRQHGLKARQETREDKFHERVREIVADDIAEYCVDAWMTPSLAAACAASAYQALLDAGYVVLPASEASTETASKVAYALGRKDAGEEIAQALEAVPAKVYPEDIFLPDSDSVDAQSARVMRFAYPAAARIARDVVSEEPQDPSSARTDLSVDTDLPQGSQAVRSPQEDA